VPERGLGRFEDLEHPLRVVVVHVEDLVQRRQVEGGEVLVRLIGHGPAGPAHRRLLAPLAVRLRWAPMDVEPALGVHAAHVDALDRARLGALEAGLALERAVLVVQELEPAAEADRDVGRHLGVHDRCLRGEEAAQGQRHPLDHPEAGHEAVEQAHRTSARWVLIAGLPGARR
jgi:hypothetical protein